MNFISYSNATFIHISHSTLLWSANKEEKSTNIKHKIIIDTTHQNNKKDAKCILKIQLSQINILLKIYFPKIKAVYSKEIQQICFG